jgi:hypothetical protein
MIDLIAKNINGSLWIVPKRRKNMSVFQKMRAQEAADRLNEVSCLRPSCPEPSLLSDKELRLLQKLQSCPSAGKSRLELSPIGSELPQVDAPQPMQLSLFERPRQ